MMTLLRARRPPIRAALRMSGAGVIAAASALHGWWGTGSSWPAQDRLELADMVLGTDDFPSKRACFTTAAVLATASAIAAKRPGGSGGRAARACIASGFTLRGVAGITGATRWLVPWEPSSRFVGLDRRYYGPLCLTIATLVAADLQRPRGSQDGRGMRSSTGLALRRRSRYRWHCERLSARRPPEDRLLGQRHSSTKRRPRPFQYGAQAQRPETAGTARGFSVNSDPSRRRSHS